MDLDFERVVLPMDVEPGLWKRGRTDGVAAAITPKVASSLLLWLVLWM